ncbi:hypothetical protein HD806DRAFT_176005 [Xylariaceae sp. AK1471]|nr:hypothetical protein HD806DRAFT_176005 [Xylariaceae sp. AK1471]
MSASTFPALTTTFTPPPECTSLYIETCNDTDCYGNAFPTGTGICAGSGGQNNETSYACYPEVTLSTGRFANGEVIYTLEVYTYSPGVYCPYGMTTATSVPLLDGIFCCPSGMRFQGGLEGGTCARTETEGTFLLSSDCTYTTIPKPDKITTTISIYAPPIFLGGQKIRNSGSSSSASSSSSWSATRSATATTSLSTIPGQGESPVDPSISVKIGVGVGIPLGVLWLLSLAFVLIKRYRRNKSKGVKSSETEDTGYSIKPVSGEDETSVYFLKPELDPSAMRIELEAPVEKDGAGIYVRKPELEGTDTSTKRGAVGVYVKRKWELDGSTSG